MSLSAQDFKALLDELKKLNKNLESIHRLMYVKEYKHLPGVKHVAVNSLAPLRKALKVAEAEVSGEKVKSLFRGIRGVLTEIQNNALRG